MKKLNVYLYIFFMTVVPQLVTLGSFALLLDFSTRQGLISSFWWIWGTLFFINFQLLLVGISNYLDNGMSIFDIVEIDYRSIKSPPITQYSYHSTTLPGGIKGVRIEKKEIRTGCLLAAGIPALINMFFGLFRFLIETIRVLISPKRRIAWKECQEGLETDNWKKGLSICLVTIILHTVVFYPLLHKDIQSLSADNLQWEITEQNHYLNGDTIDFNYLGTVTNNGKYPIFCIIGNFIAEHKNGDFILMGNEQRILFTYGSYGSDTIKQNDTFKIEIGSFMPINNEAAQKLYDMELSEINIRFVPTEITYIFDSGLFETRKSQQYINGELFVPSIMNMGIEPKIKNNIFG